MRPLVAEVYGGKMKVSGFAFKSMMESFYPGLVQLHVLT
jgi:hypothetical protein